MKVTFRYLVWTRPLSSRNIFRFCYLSLCRIWHNYYHIAQYSVEMTFRGFFCLHFNSTNNWSNSNKYDNLVSRLNFVASPTKNCASNFGVFLSQFCELVCCHLNVGYEHTCKWIRVCLFAYTRKYQLRSKFQNFEMKHPYEGNQRK